MVGEITSIQGSIENNLIKRRYCRFFESRVEWKLPELTDRLAILAMAGIRTKAHSLRSQADSLSEASGIV